jgi:hypothetical protein
VGNSKIILRKEKKRKEKRKDKRKDKINKTTEKIKHNKIAEKEKETYVSLYSIVGMPTIWNLMRE